jgi:hypothetical protein
LRTPPARLIVQPPIIVSVPAPVVPPPEVVVNVPPPAAPPPVDPPPVAPQIEPAVIGTQCVSDIETVGVPSDFQDSYAMSALLAANRYQPYEARSPVQGAAIAPDDCTIAAWTAGELFASWDGGVTFARHEVPTGIATAVVTPRRIVLLRSDGALGVVRAGTELVWRDLGVLASRNPRPMSLSAGGDWILVHDESALLGVSGDDGATWRYLTPPAPADVFEISADGRVWGTDYQAAVEGDDEEGDDDTAEGSDPEGSDPDATRPRGPRHYVTDLRSARWRHDPAALGKKGPAWTYDIVGDRSWGCGGTRKIIALHHGREVATMFGDIYDGIDSPLVVSNGRVTYALLEHASYRLRGKRIVPLADQIPVRSGNAVGVDRYGTVIAVDAAGLLRWSERGGLRRLWTAPGAPIADP